jgi:hypothetical protein
MSRRKQSDDGLAYLQQYPRLRKWINQCVTCQAIGLKPEMPVQIGPGVAAENLRRVFRDLRLNATGQCEQCDKPREANAE